MFGKTKWFSVSCCILALSVIFLQGCGEDKTKLDLPVSETRQLETAEKTAKGIKEVVADTTDKIVDKKFHVYAGKGYFKNHFAASGWMGDHGDIKISDGWKENPYSRRSCIRLVYTALKKQGAGWSGIYWQHPPNNWGNIPGGYDLSAYDKITFYAQGEKGGEVISEFKMGGIQGEFSDTASMSIGPIVLTPEWKQYTIDLKDEDLSNVVGGFAFTISEMENPDGAIFYIDEIVYE